jgi:type II secretory pathway component PulF
MSRIYPPGGLVVKSLFLIMGPDTRSNTGLKTMWRASTLANMYYKLATLVDAGIPLLRTLDAAAEGETRSVNRSLLEVRRSVGKGMGLAEAMGHHPGMFGKFDCVLIEAADTSGKLEECFKMLADWYQFLRRARNTVLTGLTYPLFMLHIAAFVIPLPGLILGRMDFWSYLWSIATGLSVFYVPVGVLIAILTLGPRWPLTRLIIDNLLLRIPLLGKGILELSISRFCRAFNMLYKAGVPIAQCFAKAPQVAGNRVVARMFEGGARAVAQGRDAGTGLSKSLPTEYVDLWRIGEECGQLDKSVDKIAEISADRADMVLTEFARWLPRIIYFAIMLMLALQVLRMAGQIGGAYNIGNW